MPTRARRTALFVLVVALFAFAACADRSSNPSAPTPTPTSGGIVPIMGPARLSSTQLVTWFNTRTPRPSGTYAATVVVETLTRFYLEEGAAEGVTGDVAFIQSIVETGWFRFNGSVPAQFNNFAGIGATDTNPNPTVFPDARTGVRAQVQHLRAYADATAVACTVPPLQNPCVDPRFDLVVPKGRAPAWNQMGNGNWATSSTYATTILTLYSELLGFHGLR